MVMRKSFVLAIASMINAKPVMEKKACRHIMFRHTGHDSDFLQ